ncbi:uncharacterized protein WM294_011187 isoform 2-T2 [Sarcoramphus papa]
MMLYELKWPKCSVATFRLSAAHQTPEILWFVGEPLGSGKQRAAPQWLEPPTWVRGPGSPLGTGVGSSGAAAALPLQCASVTPMSFRSSHPLPSSTRCSGQQEV